MGGRNERYAQHQAQRRADLSVLAETAGMATVIDALLSELAEQPECPLANDLHEEAGCPWPEDDDASETRLLRHCGNGSANAICWATVAIKRAMSTAATQAGAGPGVSNGTAGGEGEGA